MTLSRGTAEGNLGSEQASRAWSRASPPGWHTWTRCWPWFWDCWGCGWVCPGCWQSAQISAGCFGPSASSLASAGKAWRGIPWVGEDDNPHPPLLSPEAHQKILLSWCSTVILSEGAVTFAKFSGQKRFIVHCQILQRCMKHNSHRCHFQTKQFSIWICCEMGIFFCVGEFFTLTLLIPIEMTGFRLWKLPNNHKCDHTLSSHFVFHRRNYNIKIGTTYG